LSKKSFRVRKKSELGEDLKGIIRKKEELEKVKREACRIEEEKEDENWTSLLEKW